MAPNAKKFLTRSAVCCVLSSNPGSLWQGVGATGLGFVQLRQPEMERVISLPAPETVPPPFRQENAWLKISMLFEKSSHSLGLTEALNRWYLLGGFYQYLFCYAGMILYYVELSVEPGASLRLDC